MKVFRTASLVALIATLPLLYSCTKKENSDPKTIVASGSGPAIFKPIRIKKGSDEITFPQIQLSDRSESSKLVEQKINFYLQCLILDMIRPTSSLPQFLQRQDLDKLTGITGISYSVVYNSKKYLSIIISEDYKEGDHGHSYYRTFDLVHGELVSGENILTMRGVEEATDYVKENRKPFFQNELDQRLAGITNRPIRADDSIEITSEVAHEAEEASTLDMHNLLLSHDYVMPDRRFYLETGDSINNIEVSLSTLSNYLTDYGKWLLAPSNNHPVDPPTKSSYFLTGTIGNQQTTMELIPATEGDISGSYFYNFQGLPIRLDGDFTNNQLELDEFTNNYSITPTGHFSGKLDGHAFNGIWRSADGKQALSANFIVY